MHPMESETIIRFDETKNKAIVYTATRRVADLLKRRGLKPSEVTKFEGEENSWTFKVDKSSVLIRPENHIIKVGGRRTGVQEAPAWLNRGTVKGKELAEEYDSPQE